MRYFGPLTVTRVHQRTRGKILMSDEIPKDKSSQSRMPDQFTLRGLKIPPLVFTRVDTGGNTYRANLNLFTKKKTR